MQRTIISNEHHTLTEAEAATILRTAIKDGHELRYLQAIYDLDFDKCSWYCDVHDAKTGKLLGMASFSERYPEPHLLLDFWK